MNRRPPVAGGFGGRHHLHRRGDDVGLVAAPVALREASRQAVSSTRRPSLSHLNDSRLLPRKSARTSLPRPPQPNCRRAAHPSSSATPWLKTWIL